MVTLTIEQTGLLAPLVGALTGTRRYVEAELAGLARRAGETAEKIPE